RGKHQDTGAGAEHRRAGAGAEHGDRGGGGGVEFGAAFLPAGAAAAGAAARRPRGRRRRRRDAVHGQGRVGAVEEDRGPGAAHRAAQVGGRLRGCAAGRQHDGQGCQRVLRQPADLRAARLGHAQAQDRVSGDESDDVGAPDDRRPDRRAAGPAGLPDRQPRCQGPGLRRRRHGRHGRARGHCQGCHRPPRRVLPPSIL
ncbi:hypothetical protein GGI11_002077, partial [Coemansia sp. RSA 2049]